MHRAIPLYARDIREKHVRSEMRTCVFIVERKRNFKIISEDVKNISRCVISVDAHIRKRIVVEHIAACLQTRIETKTCVSYAYPFTAIQREIHTCSPSRQADQRPEHTVIQAEVDYHLCDLHLSDSD